MFRRVASIVVLSLVVLFSFLVRPIAQEEIAPEKKALIKELLELTEAKKMAENICNTMLLQQERDFPKMMSQMIAETGILKDRKQEELRKELIESRLRFSKRFRELYPQRINLEEVIEQIYYPLYDKYFTEEELRGLIKFYKSPTGRKTIKVMPHLIQESIQRSGELLTPKIMRLINEIWQEEKERLFKEGESQH